MVKSLLNDTIDYPEFKKLNKEDKNYDADLYEISLFNTIVVIALGLPNVDYIDKEIIFYPVYIIKDDKVESQIGLYEIKSSIQYSVFDDDGGVDLSKLGTILLYSHANSQGLTGDKQLPEQEEEVLLPVIKYDKIASQDAQQAELEQKAYKKTKDEDWIQTFMHNKNYTIIENEGGGDCLFASIRDGLKRTGITITVAELRDKLAREATQEIFQGFLTMYQMSQGESAIIDSDIKKYEKEYTETAKRAKATKDRDTLLALTTKASEIKALHTKSKLEKKSALDLVNEYNFMNGVISLENFKDKVRTSEFWGETWTISTLERVMKIKLILFGRETYKSKDMANVLLCGQLNDRILQDAGTFTPSQYIIVEYTGNHYRLVTYKGRGAFTFKEIPYDIKIMVVDKCMERSSGPFFLIPDFKEFMSSMKVPFPQERDINKEFDEDTSQLYNSNTVFQFYQQSANGPAPGKGSGEKINPKDSINFMTLNTIPEWRRKLSNLWIDPFTLDGHTWSSVEHFYQASKFRQNNPQFYLTFTMDANPEGALAKDPVLAKDAGSKSGKHKGKLVRPSEVKLDPTFFGGRDKETRKRALIAKFSKKDFKELLLATKDAKLQQFVRASSPVACIEIMEVRKQLMK